MNRETWDKMTSREKDALVAEKVMGWRRETIMVSWRPTEVLLGPPGIDCYNQYPSFSSDISAAFQVVERMREKKYRFELKSNGPRWEASFRDDPLHDPWVSADTIPEAICLASLLAEEG